MKRVRIAKDESAASINKSRNFTSKIRINSNKAIIIEDELLNNLAKLMQQTSQGCTAITLVNQTLLIADNNIHFGSLLEKESASAKVQLIRKIMNYFAVLANSINNKEESAEYSDANLLALRKETFTKICVERLKGEEKGYIKLDNNDLQTVAQNVIEIHDWRSQYKKIITTYNSNQKLYVSTAYELANKMLRSFKKIEKYIKNGEYQATDLIDAFKGEENNAIVLNENGGIRSQDIYQVQQEDTPGYVILNIDQVGVHSEIKIMEYLIFTGIITQVADDDYFYIGISKLCCYGCDSFLRAITEVFNLNGKIQVKNTHGLQPEWLQPMICTDHMLDMFSNGESADSEESTEENKLVYLVTKAQTQRLNELAPELKKASATENVYQEEFSASSQSSINSHIDTKVVDNLDFTSEQLLKMLQARYDNLAAQDLIAELAEKLETFEEIAFTDVGIKSTIETGVNMLGQLADFAMSNVQP